ncbi:hypothetical protein WDU94_010802 [Cyamophila willieti]
MVNNHGAEQQLSEDEDDPAGLLVDEVTNDNCKLYNKSMINSDVLMVIDTAKARTRIQVENRIATRRTRAEYGQQRGNTGRRGRRPKGLSQDAAIKSARRVLETNPANFHDFFRLANHGVRGYLRGNLLIRGQGENMPTTGSADISMGIYLSVGKAKIWLTITVLNNNYQKTKMILLACLLTRLTITVQTTDEAPMFPMEEDDRGLNIVDMYDVVEVYDIVNLGPEDLDEPYTGTYISSPT